MSSLESDKNLAGIGSILLIFPFVSIIGIILVFIGMKGMSEYYKEPGIYQNALSGLIFGIIGSVAFAAGIVLAFAVGVFTFGFGALIIVFGALVVVFVFYLLMAMHFRQAFSLLAQRTGEQSFNTAGNLLWWGAILTIIFVGLILIFIAWIFATIGFFSMRLQPQQPYASQPSGYTPPSTPPVAQPTQATRYCPNCGAPVEPNTAFCPHCGKQLPQ
ncbi:MAG: DUF996 domain-containing protein [Candidatus Bathyarchaeia archaeon]|jgi:uncharacterized membrane protein